MWQHAGSPARPGSDCRAEKVAGSEIKFGGVCVLNWVLRRRFACWLMKASKLMNSFFLYSRTSRNLFNSAQCGGKSLANGLLLRHQMYTCPNGEETQDDLES